MDKKIKEVIVRYLDGSEQMITTGVIITIESKPNEKVVMDFHLRAINMKKNNFQTYLKGMAKFAGENMDESTFLELEREVDEEEAARHRTSNGLN